MEQVFYRAHVRLLSVTNGYLPYTIRRALEFIVLIIAVFCLTCLCLMHLTYVTNASSPRLNCILSAFDSVGLTTYLLENKTSHIDYMKHTYDVIVIRINENYKPFQQIIDRIPDETHHVNHTIEKELCQATHALSDSTSQSCESIDQHNPSYFSFSPDYKISKGQSTLDQLIALNSSSIYMFSYYRGILVLTEENHTFSNLTILDIELNPQSTCFGPPVSQLTARYITGYDVIVMNWVIKSFGGIGYLYNYLSKEMINLNYAADFVAKKGINIDDMGKSESYQPRNTYITRILSYAKRSILGPLVIFAYEKCSIAIQRIEELIIHYSQMNQDMPSILTETFLQILRPINQYFAFRLGVLFSTTFLFFICSTLVSFILRETQERMLRFTYLLQYHITHRLPYFTLIFTHVTESLVFVPIMMGIYFFLFEFFSDQLVR